MIDCSHANSGKDYNRQPIVCHEIAEQVAAGNRDILGVMIESNLVAGTQKLEAGKSLNDLVYGQSITDGCVDWPTTHSMLTELAAAVRSRRTVTQATEALSSAAAK
jgi:3-deoxy-7-phosphoheptulonate synthase